MTTLPSSGPIKMSDLRSVLGPGGSGPISMSEYKTTGYSNGIAGITDTNLALSQFYGKSKPVVTLITANTANWRIPMPMSAFILNAVSFNCRIKSIKYYIGNGNNGTNISIWTSNGLTFLSGFWVFVPYNLFTLTPSGITYGSNSYSSSYFVTPLDTQIPAGTVLTVYISTLSASNYLYVGYDTRTPIGRGYRYYLGFSIDYQPY